MVSVVMASPGWRDGVAMVFVVVLLAACGAKPATHPPTTSTVAPSASSPPPLPSASPSPTSTVPTGSVPTGPVPTGPVPTSAVLHKSGWTPVTSLASGVVIDVQAVTMTSGARVTLIRFRSDQVRLHLHVGSQEPPTRGITLTADAQPQVSAIERPVLLAAFNGGFKVAARAGGYEVDGQVITPLVAGMASLVIDADGSAHIGIWGVDTPAAGEAVVSVRQNLPPLIAGSHPSPSIGVIKAWGATLHGLSLQPRSAFGQDASGNFIYAGSMSSLPVDLATPLLSAGVTVAMQLDINPTTVQAEVASSPGGPLMAMVPGQPAPVDRYLRGWTRDFITLDALG